MSDKLTAEELAKVRAKYPLSRDVEMLSGGGFVFKAETLLVSATQPPCGVSEEENKRIGMINLSPENSPPTNERTTDLRSASKTSDPYNQGDSSILQELQNVDNKRQAREAASSSDVDYQTGASEEDGRDYGIFHVSITLRMADRRRKDIDGMLSSIFDCLVHARRRLLDPHQDDSSSSRTRSRKRGGKHHNPEKITKLPF